MLPRDAEDNICTEVSLPIQIKPITATCYCYSFWRKKGAANAAVAPAKGLIHEQPRSKKGPLMLRNHASFISGDGVMRQDPPQTEGTVTVTLSHYWGPTGPTTTKKHFETENHNVVSLLHSLDRKRLQFFHNSGACSWQQLHRSEIRSCQARGGDATILAFALFERIASMSGTAVYI